MPLAGEDITAQSARFYFYLPYFFQYVCRFHDICLMHKIIVRKNAGALFFLAHCFLWHFYLVDNLTDDFLC